MKIDLSGIIFIYENNRILLKFARITMDPLPAVLLSLFNFINVSKADSIQSLLLTPLSFTRVSKQNDSFPILPFCYYKISPYNKNSLTSP